MSTPTYTNITDIPTNLAKRILLMLNEKKKCVPIRNKITIDVTLRNLKLGRKRDISKDRYERALNFEYKHMLDVMNIKWGERKYIKKLLKNTMGKMYNVV